MAKLNKKSKYKSRFRVFLDKFKGKNLVFYIIFLALQVLGVAFSAISLFVPINDSVDGGLITSLFFVDFSVNIIFYIGLILIAIGVYVTTLVVFLRTRKMSSIGPAFELVLNILILCLSGKGDGILSTGNITLIVLSLIFSILTIIESIIHAIIFRNSTNIHKSVILPLCLNFVAAAVSFLGLLLPIGFNSENAYANPDIEYVDVPYNNNSLLGALFGPNQFEDPLVISCVVFILIFVFGLFLFRKTLTYCNKESHNKFTTYVQLSTFFYAAYSGLYLLFTIIFSIIIKNLGAVEYATEILISYIPLIVTAIICFIQSFLVGKVKEKENKARDKNKDTKSLRTKKNKFFIISCIIESCLFASFIVSFVVRFLTMTYEGEEICSYSAFNILTQAKENDPLSFVIFLFIALLVINSILFLLSLCSLLSGNDSSISISRLFIVISFLSVFAIFVFSIYFTVSSRSTPSFIEKIMPFTAEELNDYIGGIKISSDELIPFIISTVLIFAEIIIRPLDKYQKYYKEIEKHLEPIPDFPSSPIDDNLMPENLDLDNPQDDLEGPSKVALVDDNKLTFDNCPSFTELDLRKKQYDSILEKKKATAFEDLTLPNLVKFIVNYAKNSRLHLSYTKENIATFLAGLGCTRLSILQGMSGTGKTSLPKIFLEAIYGNCEIIEVESSWRDKNELLGYYNDFSKTYSPKKFTRALYKAVLNPETVTFIVLDEMNLSRIEYYFSDFLSLMENEEGKRQIRLLNNQIFNTYDNEKHSYLGLKDNHTIIIPSNVWFIGTANRDESTFEISDKVYDRAATMNFDKRAPSITNYGDPMKQSFVEYSALRELFDNVPSLDFSIDKCAPIAEIEKLLSPYNISFGNRIAKQIESFVRIYCACFDNPMSQLSTALETILLSKVVRKLEVKNVTNKEQLVTAFTKLGFKKCAEFINGLNEDI